MTRSNTSWQKEYAQLAVEISQETGYELPDNVYRIAGVKKPLVSHKPKFWRRKKIAN